MAMTSGGQSWSRFILLLFQMRPFFCHSCLSTSLTVKHRNFTRIDLGWEPFGGGGDSALCARWICSAVMMCHLHKISLTDQSRSLCYTKKAFGPYRVCHIESYWISAKTVYPLRDRGTHCKLCEYDRFSN